MHSLRSRLFDGMADETRDGTFSYSRRIGPLVEVMCRDSPTHVTTLTDAHLEGRDLELFFAAARKNTEVEPSNLSSVDVEGGGPMWLLEGDHFFVSSQLPSLPARIAERAGVPAVGEGVLAVAPRRGFLVGVPLIDEDSLKGVGMLFDFMDRFDDETRFGGCITSTTRRCRRWRREADSATGRSCRTSAARTAPAAKSFVVVDGPFEDAMMRTGLINPGGPAGGDAGPGQGER